MQNFVSLRSDNYYAHAYPVWRADDIRPYEKSHCHSEPVEESAHSNKREKTKKQIIKEYGLYTRTPIFYMIKGFTVIICRERRFAVPNAPQRHITPRRAG